MSDGARIAAGVLCLLVLVGIAAPVAGQAATGAGIGDVTISGDGVIDTGETGNASTYLWHDQSANVSVTFTDYPTARNYYVCLGYERGGAPAKKLANCDPIALPDGANGTAEFTNVTWPANATGRQGLTVELQRLSNKSNATVLDRKTVPVTVLRKQGDFDDDGLANAREVEKGYNVSNRDMDSDGLSDGAEVKRYHTKPQNPDSDGDGIRDGVEIRRGTDPQSADSDGDGLSDSTESALGTNPKSPWTPVWIVGGALVIIVLVVAAFVLLRRRWRERGGESPTNGDAASRPPSANHERVESPESRPEPDSTPEPLTDADRVLALLDSHGGRMKQTRIVEETEWSKAKVSRLLSSMNDEGEIDKLSIGRENIISLDGHGPEAARSPHEENASD